MPLKIPKLDDRNYQKLLDEALARIPVHTPEWTNFNESDPGVTLIELFAFLTENLLYRANLIPERNRLKFLSLLGIPLQPAASARGIVTFTNEQSGMKTVTLNAGLEVFAGSVPFRTTLGLDVLPVEARVYYKRTYEANKPELTEYYRQLYASYRGTAPPSEIDFKLYETVPLEGKDVGINLGTDAVDHSLWIALLARPKDTVDTLRTELAGKTLNIGIAPSLDNAQGRILPGGHANPEAESLLQYWIPQLPDKGLLPQDPKQRVAEYKLLDAKGSADVLTEPGVVQITLPQKPAELDLWKNLDPLEQGVGDFPPALPDAKLSDRVVTWIRISSPAAPKIRLLWVGINAVPVFQRAQIANERLPDGSGEPDQTAVLSKTPVIPGTLRLSVSGDTELWQEIDDLTSAGPEVPVADPRNPPGTVVVKNERNKVFRLDPESGEIRFGDGMRGKRPPLNAQMFASYHYGVGRDGNVNAGAINGGPVLPPGIKVGNPIATWGGAEAESVGEGEKQIARFLQHRDRLVSADDFTTITMRTPGVDIGRVEVIPAFNPELGSNEPGDAPGAVTLMVIPAYDPKQPDAPLPEKPFIESICSHLESRRLVTTEVFLRAPTYKKIWISAGFNVIAGKSTSSAEVREAVKKELVRFLSPLPAAARPGEIAAGASQFSYYPGGWPLWNPVVAKELVAVISRVPGVSLVNNVLLGEESKPPGDQVEMRGLELPRIMGLSVTVGDPLSLDQLRGQAGEFVQPGTEGTGTAPAFLPIPLIPEECR
ncbi:MAG: baseplate J/gp47 family protein [Desulfuromonadaceae bacterium]|nr:baseplate J/gp47 family protein [Desulfuromonadaceae bacterium]